MSTSAFCNFIGSGKSVDAIEAHRQNAMSPSSLATTSSASNSNSSLNQYNSLTQIPSTNSTSFRSSSSSSTTSSTASCSIATINTPSSSCKTLARNLCSSNSTTVRDHHSNCNNNNTNSVSNGNKIQTSLSRIPSLQNYHIAHRLANSSSVSPPTRERLRQASLTPTQNVLPFAHNYLDDHHIEQSGRPAPTRAMRTSQTMQSFEPKPYKPFKSSSEYLEAMKEDLAEWLNRLYPDLELTAENFFEQLETGWIICRHSNSVTQMGRTYILEKRQESSPQPQDLNSIDCDVKKSLSPIEPNNNSLTNNPSQKRSNVSFRQNANGYQFSAMRHSNSLDFFSTNSCHIKPNNNNSLHSLNARNNMRLDCRSTEIDWFKVKMVPYKKNAIRGTFFARDNICQFILWCRSLNIMECLLFETDDLAARKNEKSFILCLLEVARIGFNVGMPTPLIIQLEHEIDREIENEAILQNQYNNGHNEQSCQQLPLSDRNSREQNLDACCNNNAIVSSINDAVPQEKDDLAEAQDMSPKPQVITNDLLSLHEKVVQLLCQCTCPTQFPMVRIGDGKYKVGDKLIIFVRILRRHIMVRVGGGWQELSEFLQLKDPCRSRS